MVRGQWASASCRCCTAMMTLSTKGVRPRTTPCHANVCSLVKSNQIAHYIQVVRGFVRTVCSLRVRDVEPSPTRHTMQVSHQHDAQSQHRPLGSGDGPRWLNSLSSPSSFLQALVFVVLWRYFSTLLHARRHHNCQGFHIRFHVPATSLLSGAHRYPISIPSPTCFLITHIQPVKSGSAFLAQSKGGIVFVVAMS